MSLPLYRYTILYPNHPPTVLYSTKHCTVSHDKLAGQAVTSSLECFTVGCSNESGVMDLSPESQIKSCGDSLEKDEIREKASTSSV
jgi:hypothetical protein